MPITEEDSMRYNKKRLAVVIAAAGLVIAAGAAYTDQLSTTAAVTANPGYQTVGYGDVTVSGGGSLVAVQYNLNGNDPPTATSVTFVMSGDLIGDEGFVGFADHLSLGAACDPQYNLAATDTALGVTDDTTYNDCTLPAPYAAGIALATVATLGSLDLAVVPGPPLGAPGLIEPT